MSSPLVESLVQKEESLGHVVVTRWIHLTQHCTLELELPHDALELVSLEATQPHRSLHQVYRSHLTISEDV